MVVYCPSCLSHSFLLYIHDIPREGIISLTCVHENILFFFFKFHAKWFASKLLACRSNFGMSKKIISSSLPRDHCHKTIGRKMIFFFYTLLFYSALHFLVSCCLLSPLSVSFRHTGHSKRVYDLVNMPPRKQSLALLLLLFFPVWDTCGILGGSLLCRTTLVLPISFLPHCLSPGCERKLRVSLFRYVRWQNENLNRV